MSDSDSRPNGRPGDETRRKILEVARGLFGSIGFDATTVKTIAEAVGLTDAALYYHFKSKRQILNAVWEMPIKTAQLRVRPDGEFSGEHLDAITDSVIDFSVANEHFLRLMSREILSGDETALALRQQSRAALRRTLHENFRTVVDADEADIRSEAVMLLLTGANMRAHIAFGPDYIQIASAADFRNRLRARARAIARLGESQAS